MKKCAICLMTANVRFEATNSNSKVVSGTRIWCMIVLVIDQKLWMTIVLVSLNCSIKKCAIWVWTICLQTTKIVISNTIHFLTICFVRQNVSDHVFNTYELFTVKSVVSHCDLSPEWSICTVGSVDLSPCSAVVVSMM